MRSCRNDPVWVCFGVAAVLCEVFDGVDVVVSEVDVRFSLVVLVTEIPSDSQFTLCSAVRVLETGAPIREIVEGRHRRGKAVPQGGVKVSGVKTDFVF